MGQISSQNQLFDIGFESRTVSIEKIEDILYIEGNKKLTKSPQLRKHKIRHGNEVQ